MIVRPFGRTHDASRCCNRRKQWTKPSYMCELSVLALLAVSIEKIELCFRHQLWPVRAYLDRHDSWFEFNNFETNLATRFNAQSIRKNCIGWVNQYAEKMYVYIFIYIWIFSSLSTFQQKGFWNFKKSIFLSADRQHAKNIFSNF